VAQAAAEQLLQPDRKSIITAITGLRIARITALLTRIEKARSITARGLGAMTTTVTLHQVAGLPLLRIPRLRAAHIVAGQAQDPMEGPGAEINTTKLVTC